MDAQVDLTERSVFNKNSNIRVQVDSEPLISWLCGPLGEMASLEYLRKRSKECAENDKRLVRKIGKLKNQPYMYYPVPHLPHQQQPLHHLDGMLYQIPGLMIQYQIEPMFHQLQVLQIQILQ